MSNRYQMTISLNVLNHLGLSLYSNTPAVLAEVIANAWDADATEVHVDFDRFDNTITVTDNGVGMDEADINTKYLYVGYQKRDSTKAPLKTRAGRLPMGRKGIGKGLGKRRAPTAGRERFGGERHKGHDVYGVDRIRAFQIPRFQPSIGGSERPAPADREDTGARDGGGGDEPA